MLCLFFGVIVASVLWPWLGVWATLAGLGAAGALFLTLKFWPDKADKPSSQEKP
jgi:hypothetical protein